MSWRWWIICVAVATIGGAAAALMTMSSEDDSRDPEFETFLDPPFLKETTSVRSLDGTKIDLHAPTSGALAVIFYSTECPIASASLPAAARLAADPELRPLLMLGVCVDRDLNDAEVAARAQAGGLGFPIARDLNGELAQTFGVSIAPEAFVLDERGRLRYRGRIDGRFPARGQSRPAVPGQDLRIAIAATLAGARADVPYLEPVGCPLPEPPPLLSTATSPANAPTYARDIEPIVARSCRNCHQPRGSGPFSLLTYEQAAKRSRDLADVVGQRLMPPWKPTPGKGPPLLHDRTLLRSEIAALRAWADAGAPRGAELPSLTPTQLASATSAGEWELGAPDLILEMPEPFAVPATGDDIYRCFVMPVSLDRDQFIASMEIKPGNPRVVHHTFIYTDNRGLGRQRDRDDPGPGYMCFSGFAGDQIFGAMGGWTPGNEPHPFGEGIGMNLPKSVDVVMQVHYHPSGKPETDRTRIGLRFAREPVRQALQWVSACADPATFELPAGDENRRISSELTLPLDVDLHAMTPHMHLLGRSFQATAIFPDGRARPLIAIDDWDFNRQDTYYLRRPLRLPRGTIVRIEGRFDNSTSNPKNPSRPPRWVRWGEATTDDMLILFLALTQADQDLTRPGATDTFMERFFEQAESSKPR